MKTYRNFIQLYSDREKLTNDGWIYIKENDFQDLENASFYLLDSDEGHPDNYIETDDDVIPKILYDIDSSITALVEIHIFRSIYENMDTLNKKFTLEDKIESLYYYVEEDTFLY